MVIPLASPDELSLYFHIPFCKRKCDYCHFYVIPDKEEYKNLLMEALKKEWFFRLPHIRNRKLSTIYFGGGTPALFGPERIAELLSLVDNSFPLNEKIEITIEANPEDVTEELMTGYRKAGINRVSIGVQSFDDSELSVLTRRHDANKALSAVHHTYAAGIVNISIDLMYDLPNQSLALWEKTLTKVEGLPISHLSLYNLTIEEHTVFYKNRDKLSKSMPNEETGLEMYTKAGTMLESIGLKQYEISAFAKDGFYSKHNTGYWLGRPFLGFGPSSYSYWEGQRFQNIPHLNKYVEKLNTNESPALASDGLSHEERRRELFVVAMRLTTGVDLNEFTLHHGRLDENTYSMLSRLLEDGLLSKEQDRYRLTERGKNLYNYVASELI